MFEYLREISTRLDEAAAAGKTGGGQSVKAPPADPISLFRGFAEEITQLDARDFEPSVRAEFVELRAFIKHLAGKQSGLIVSSCALYVRKVIPLLDAYQGEGSRAITRDFSFVNETEVKKIIERDYKELKLRAFPDGAWKSTVILSGGILEAILYDQLTKDPATIALAMASPDAPQKGRKTSRTTKNIASHAWQDQWNLADMIKVAADIGLISQSNEDSVDEVLREYRNYVHPRVEVQKGISISEGHAMTSVGCLEVIIDKLK